ncbi:MAG: 16S rRNA (uracil(1498)-N(3))-methyltransferase [Cephaloticoccus sp.]|nr:16S rRNA (uracil(1498)-N(3))-methyltransferase [Cephaloticoccus sp.]MCF7762021.1 16S rRNA (uracil(1498)-N(3))-methyltransferase [Cephaloticoccus sp.]
MLQSTIWPHLNLVLFNRQEIDHPLPLTDHRAMHLLSVLHRRPGDSFDAGIINGPKGKGTLLELGPDHLSFTFSGTEEPPPVDPIALLIGLPRPQTARKILQETTTLGVAALHFVRTEKGEPSYADSNLWHSLEWRRHVTAGAAQAFCTQVPIVSHGQPLPEAIDLLPAGGNRIALDNYEAPTRFSDYQLADKLPTVVAFGAERGWSAKEREMLRNNGFTFAHLGPRVLRLETAVMAALVLLKAQRGSI